MSQPPVPRISDDDDDDTSHVSTPVLAHLPASPLLPSSLPPSGSTSSESTKPASVLPGNAHLRLPIPTPSANLSQTSFTFVDVSEDGSGVDFNDLPPEVTSADISIAREFLCSVSVSRLRLLRACIAWRTSLLGCFCVMKWEYVVGIFRRLGVLLFPWIVLRPITLPASILGHLLELFISGLTTCVR